MAPICAWVSMAMAIVAAWWMTQGHELFADKVGVLLARDLSLTHKNPQFVVDVKSTGLYLTDPVLKSRGVKTDYWKTGHSYIKRRTSELGALAGFEKSGHFFFNEPIGRGYDDGIVAAIAVLEMLDRAGKKLSTLVGELPKTWGSPTMSPYCPDDKKYAVVDALTKEYEAQAAKGEKILGQKIAERCHGQRRARHARRWNMVPGARVIQQAVAGGGGRKPRLGSQHARHLRRSRCAAFEAQGSRRIRPEDLEDHRALSVRRFRIAAA